MHAHFLPCERKTRGRGVRKEVTGVAATSRMMKIKMRIRETGEGRETEGEEERCHKNALTFFLSMSSNISFLSLSLSLSSPSLALR